MLLYWKDAAADGAWENAANWFEDSAATTNHGELPASGDSCTLADGVFARVTIGSDATVAIGTGVCDFDAGSLENYGTINNGVFTCIYGVESYGTINGGTFTCDNCVNYGTVNGGTFTGQYVTNILNSSTINWGIFTGNGFTQSGDGPINGGIFTGSGFTNWGDPITGTPGGLWLQNGSLTLDGVTVVGSGDANPGFPHTLSASGGISPTDVVAPEYVQVGHDNYVGGSPGTLHVSDFGLQSTDLRAGVTIDDVTGSLAAGGSSGQILTFSQ